MKNCVTCTVDMPSALTDNLHVHVAVFNHKLESELIDLCYIHAVPWDML